MLRSVKATAYEVSTPLPGDGLVRADVVMDRAFTLAATPAQVWPWLVQLGKGRAGWYLPRSVERALPRRALRVLEPRWLGLSPGDVVPDYGPDGSFTAVQVEHPSVLLFRSQRGRVSLTWAIVLTSVSEGTRVHLRLRLGPVRHVHVAGLLGGAFDALTIAGMAAGLRERLADQGDRTRPDRDTPVR